jgi:pyruvate formate lyase activating enzyme
MGAGGCALCLAGVWGRPLPAGADQGGMPTLGLIRESPAAWFTPLGNKAVQCDLCPKSCRISRGSRGFCRVRENRDGRLVSLVYGNPCAFHLDPVEKNPFFHVLPGSASLAVATAGCNFSCKFCQTWEISQAGPEEVFSFDISPGLVIKRAREMEAQSVAYTFVEPVVYYEYMRSVGRLAAEAGLLSLIHSNGFINPEPLSDLIPFLHAANIDLKSIDDAFYRDLCGGSLEPVLAAMKQLRASGVHLEITNLVVPTRNDDMDRIKAMCGWIRDELGPDTPLHFWRFYPLYKLRNLPPTPVAVLERARQTAQAEGLQYVYIGNIPGHEGENTFCPVCKKVVIRRTGYMVGEMHLSGGKCDFCGHRIPGVWSRDPFLLKQAAQI